MSSEVSQIYDSIGVKKSKDYSGQLEGGQYWCVLNGDAATRLKDVPDESINCVVTSPPYYWLRDYDVEGQIGLEETVDEYVSSLVKVMTEIYRVLRKDGTLFLNIGDTYYSGRGQSQGKDKKSKKRRFGLRAVDKSGGLGIGLQKKSAIGIPWRVAIAMCEHEWILRSPIVWHRDKCLPEFVRDRPRRSYEFVFMFAKDRYYFFDKTPLVDQNFDEDVWTIPPEKGDKGLDTAPYPEELVRRCLSIGCPEKGIVLDPFLGSGTTALAALKSGRSAIGVELNKEFCAHVNKKIRATHEVL
ncbi:DNA-methyltransferase [Pontiella sulfatireligans]|uniref:Methyltransferase n=1 Tax=Pontiella sulfatireligans TaxID=2750658 RepID=A0A6C2US08_9BACT|nr:site-specific DNA-methyltransferase [Pontiella sulfatireligans]VGO21716.1 Modification methylase DpnIIB [Pontiella sulfatireligans]